MEKGGAVKVHYDIQDDAVKGIDIRTTPVEGLVLHTALLEYAYNLENNKHDRKIALQMCDAYIEAMERREP